MSDREIIAEQNRRMAERGERIRNQELDSVDGWFKGIRLASVFSVRPKGESLEVMTGWNGSAYTFMIDVPFDKTEDPEENTIRLMASRNAMAKIFMGNI